MKKISHTSKIAQALLLFSISHSYISCNQSGSKKHVDEIVSNKPLSKIEIPNRDSLRVNDSIEKLINNDTQIEIDQNTFSTFDKINILKRLFDSQYINDKNEVLWKPNYYERMNFIISDDGYCHTTIDTLISYNSIYKLIVFSTTKDGFDCHACSPLISIATIFKDDKGVWTIDLFEKNFSEFGSSGNTGSYGVERLGDNLYCLKLHHNIDGNQGEFEGWEEFYAIDYYFPGDFTSNTDIRNWEPLKNVFSYRYYYSVNGSYEKYANVPDENATIKIIYSKGKNIQYKIQLITKKSEKETVIENFNYSNKKGIYVLIK